MGSIFSTKKTNVDEKDKAILDLKLARDKLQKYRKKVLKHVSSFID